MVNYDQEISILNVFLDTATIVKSYLGLYIIRWNGANEVRVKSSIPQLGGSGGIADLEQPDVVWERADNARDCLRVCAEIRPEHSLKE